MTTKLKIKPINNKGDSNKALSFPAKEIESCIRDFLAEENEMTSELRGDTSNASIVGPKTGIDSLVCVEVLTELESIVPFSLSEKLIRAGGYDDVDEVVNDLMPQINNEWKKYHGEKS